LPGEEARAAIAHVDRRRRAFGSVLSVLSPSPARVSPACARFLDCSGCDLLHASLEAQLEAKRARVASALALPLDRVDPVIASPRTFGYRALAKLVVGPGGVLGSYRARSHDVADMSGCAVHAPEVERIVEAIRSLRLSAIRYVLVRASLDEARAIVVLVTLEERCDEVARVASALEPRHDVAAVYQHVNASAGDELIGSGAFRAVFEKGVVRERIGSLVFELRPGAFAQVNPLAAALLYARAASFADAAGHRVLDLYSGSAGLALTLARAGARSVVGVEASLAAVEAGRRSAEENGAGAVVELVHARAEDALSGTFDVVTLNPPRKGAAREVLEGILRLAPARVVYVSCNPDTLARDVALLAPGLEIRRVTPVDLFPGTRHVETVALLSTA
jgi:23S rRNA (uracil1939-C5)-methyltransferase